MPPNNFAACLVTFTLHRLCYVTPYKYSFRNQQSPYFTHHSDNQEGADIHTIVCIPRTLTLEFSRRIHRRIYQKGIRRKSNPKEPNVTDGLINWWSRTRCISLAPPHPDKHGIPSTKIKQSCNWLILAKICIACVTFVGILENSAYGVLMFPAEVLF